MCAGLDRRPAPEEGLGDRPTERILGFLRALREEGYRVGVQEELDALRVARIGNVVDPRRMRWALRALLCTRSEEWHRFDDLFYDYWRAGQRRAGLRASRRVPADPAGRRGGQPAGARADDVDWAGTSDDELVEGGGSRGGASSRETDRQADFQFLTDERQMRRLERYVEHLARRMRRRITRRLRVQRQGRQIHLRRTLRANLQHGGTPLELVFRRRRRRLPRLVLLLDVSRSMSLYSYFFLRFARGIVTAFSDADAFAFHTRLIPITDALRERELHKLRQKLELISQGWSGGTRIGDSLETFNRDYAAGRVGSRSLVIVLSDGFDTGPAERLGAEMARLKAGVRRVIWLNPMAGQEGYQPLARGMQAALPYVDLFAPAHNLESLIALEPQLTGL